MNEAVEFLKSKKKYGRLLSNWESTKKLDYGFELLFCFQCESEGLELIHEVSANTINNKTVDFQAKIDGVSLNFELVRPGLNKGIRELKRNDELEGYILNSNDADPDFRTGAQIIKLQWSLLEKAKKFSQPNNENINIVCVDCSNIHAGMLDQHDVAITMWGKPYNPCFVELWEGERIKGILEAEYAQRDADLLKNNISAVIFIKKLKISPLNDAYIAINSLLTSEHASAVVQTLKKCSAFGKIRICKSI